MNKQWVAAVLVTALSPLAQADALGLFAGISGWNADLSGNVQSGPESIDVENELGLGDDTFVQAYVAFEHFIPLVPNVRLQHTAMSQSGSGNLNKSFKGENFSGDVVTDLDLTHTDLLAYWRLLDNVVNLDLGLQARVFDGEVSIRQDSTNTATTEAIDDIVPMVYGAAGVDLPLTGLSAGVAVSAISFDGSSLRDITARVNYEIAIVGVELGWRQIDLELDDVGDVDTDLSQGGPFLGVNLHF